MFRVKKKKELDGRSSRKRGPTHHCHLTAVLSFATCVAILLAGAANVCLGRENDRLGDEPSLLLSPVAESALPTSVEILQNSGARLEGLPPFQSVAPAIVTADSRPIRNPGSHPWSPWYRLAVGKAPAGYARQRVEFWMTGNSECGSSAECKEIIHDDSRVVWKFRIRSQSEVRSGSGGCSVAHLRVFYGAHN